HKRFLQRVIPTKALDRRDARAIDLCKRHEARIDGKAVDEDSACTAFTFPAPFFSAGEMTVCPQHVQQSRHRMRAHVGAFAVQREAHAMIFSGVAGISRTSTPACRIAFTTAGAGPSIGISPTPFAPNGPLVYACSSNTTSMDGVSSVVGMM